MKREYVVIIFTFVLMVVFAAFSYAVGIEECVKLAVGNNSNLLLCREEINISKIKTKQAESLFKPKIYLGAYYDYYSLDYPSIFSSSIGAFNLQEASDNFYGTRLTLTQTLYTGGKDTTLRKQASQKYLEAEASYLTEKNKVIYEVRRGFIEITYLAKNIQTLVNAQAGLEKIEDEDKKKIENALQKDKLQLEKQINDATYGFNAVICTEFIESSKISGDVEIDNKMLGEDRTKLVILAQQHRPELKSLKAKESVDSLSVGLEKTLKFPNVDFFSEYDYLHATGNEWESNFQVGLSMTIPLFDGGARFQKYMERDSLLRKTRIIVSSEEDRIKREVEAAYEKMLIAKKMYDMALNEKQSFAMPGKIRAEDINNWNALMINFQICEKELLQSIAYLEFTTGSEISKY